MVKRGILSKNYFIDPVEVAELGTNITQVMSETDRTMEEASEIIAKISSLTESIPSHIRCEALLEMCTSAQAEIKSFDFLSYGLRVDQGLQNLLEENQYFTECFMKKMRANTERMQGLENEFRRLADSIMYAEEKAHPNEMASSIVSNAETANTDDTEEELSNQDWEKETGEAMDGTGTVEWNAMFPCAGVEAVLNTPIDGEFITYAEEGEIRDSDNILQFFMPYGKETQIAINLLDTQICNKLGITDIEDRKNIIQTILDENPSVFNNLYILNTYSSADYQRLMFITLFDIEQKYRFLDVDGYLFLCENEIGARSGWSKDENLRLDEDGNIIEMRIQDINDGGYTIGFGMFFSEEYDDRIALAKSLGVNWDNPGEWVTIENINIMFSYIAQEYTGYVKTVEKETGIIFTPVQYAAVYDLLYFRPILRFYYIDLIKENADREVWITTLINAVRTEAGEDAWAKYGNGWTARIERSVNSYFDGVYYPKE